MNQASVAILRNHTTLDFTTKMPHKVFVYTTNVTTRAVQLINTARADKHKAGTVCTAPWQSAVEISTKTNAGCPRFGATISKLR